MIMTLVTMFYRLKCILSTPTRPLSVAQPFCIADEDVTGSSIYNACNKITVFRPFGAV